ncbi:unnamed protein product [Paramecium octaurelia]|uniref:Peptidase A1 domain-containing protein n=1 Tax=Paramecium octaurelia TaxID=43137 RepID=A0A8S1VSQ3_PAROT|nr:unnamed protein product [Paramecium octaurelia]
MNIFLYSLLIVLVFCGQEQGTFLQDQSTTTQENKLYTIKLKETHTIVSAKEMYDFLTTKQTYFRQQTPIDVQEIEFGDYVPKPQQTSEKRQADLKLHNFKNTQFTGPITVGDQEFQVIFDTGSANFWIDSVKCKNEGCKQHTQYKPSFRSKHLGYALNVQFGTGDLNGEVNSDVVKLGEIEVEDQNIAEIVEENGAVFQNSGFDGIVGLAYPSMAAYNLNPLFDNIMKQKKLQSNQFSFYMSNKVNSYESQLTFGGYDVTKLDGPVHYHPVIDKYYWTIKAENILVNGQDQGFCPKGCKVVADTGTSLITGPYDDLMKLLDLTNIDDNCSNLKELPTLTFRIDGVNYYLEAKDYIMELKEDGTEIPLSNEVSASAFIEGSAKQCIGAFMPLDIPDPQGPAWILGDIFLTKYLSIYDRDVNMVGFGKAKH